MPATLPWSEWKTLVPSLPSLSPSTFFELVDGGQAFRWIRQSDDSFIGQWDAFVVSLRLDPAGNLLWRAPTAGKSKTEAALRAYLGCDADFAGIIDSLPWRS